jgi:hypothetical protein
LTSGCDDGRGGSDGSSSETSVRRDDFVAAVVGIVLSSNEIVLRMNGVVCG